MRRLAASAALFTSVLLLAPNRADANIIIAHVVVQIDKATQRMSVSVDGSDQYTWPVSTGRPGHGTPNGVYKPELMVRHWFSRKYYNAPMPHSIFFHEGFAIHGSTAISQLGGPASHGCVRLHPANAATLFALVKKYGMDSTAIIISASRPASVASKPPRAKPHTHPVGKDLGAGDGRRLESPVPAESSAHSWDDRQLR